ncbi:MAG: hypothetical protein AB7I30_10590 [Isosphaeraceae bacterium]
MTPSFLEPGPDGPARVWRIGGSIIRTYASEGAWSVRIERPEWGDLPLEFLSRFADENEAVAWCEKLAEVLRRDGLDDHLSF